MARDLRENRQVLAAGELEEFQEIKANLDARRLLAELSQSHGLIPDRFEVTKGQDGADRIRAGTRNLNVSDFLTKEMNLSWEDTAGILRQVYAKQLQLAPEASKRRQPSRQLWDQFQEHRKAGAGQARAATWDAQRESERERRAAIKTEFQEKRSRIQGDRNLTTAKRKAAVSVARMERIALEGALRESIKAERARLKETLHKPLSEAYRDFLSGRAGRGDEEALQELRRMRPEALERELASDQLVKPGGQQDLAKIYRAPALTFKVHRNGDVTYRRDGKEVIRDSGRRLKMLKNDEHTIETGLRLAQQKYGRSLAISGPQAFQEKIARIAADAGLNVTFTDDRLNQVLQERRAELDAGKRKAGQVATMALDPDTARGRYTGKIVDVDARYVYQDAGGGKIYRHRLEQLEATPSKDQGVTIAYSQGKAMVKGLGLDRDPGVER